MITTVLRFDTIGCGPVDHPQKIMEKMSSIHHFKVVESEPIPAADCWLFTVEHEDELSYLPCYVEKIK